MHDKEGGHSFTAFCEATVYVNIQVIVTEFLNINAADAEIVGTRDHDR